MSILNYIVSQSVSLIWNKNKSPSPYPYHILTISLPYPYHSFYPIVSSLAFHTAIFGSRNVSRWTVLDIHLGSKRKHGTKTMNQIISQFSWYKIPKIYLSFRGSYHSYPMFVDLWSPFLVLQVKKTLPAKLQWSGAWQQSGNRPTFGHNRSHRVDVWFKPSLHLK